MHDGELTLVSVLARVRTRCCNEAGQYFEVTRVFTLSHDHCLGYHRTVNALYATAVCHWLS
jgi:hypothetical protein